MPGDNRNKWFPHQLALLEQLDGDGVPFEEIAPRVGHPRSSCQTKMSEIRSARREAERSKPGEIAALRKPAMAAPAAPNPPPAPRAPAVVAEPSHARTTSTARLVMDAELRRRIEVLGVTGGMLGDPEPGRSALDQRRAALASAPMERPTLPRRSALDQMRSSNA